ncbi:MAG: hypothetical protein JSU96_07250, partial [Acidobacteriota bacterium]
MSKLKGVLLLALVGVLGTIGFYWDTSPPEVGWGDEVILGRHGVVKITVEDSGKGLRSVEVILRQGESEEVVAGQSADRTMWPWETSSGSASFQIVLSEVESRLQDGPLEVEVVAVDQGNLWLLSRETRDIRQFELDTQPPRVAPVSQQHYLRQGGSEAIVYQLSEAGCSSGVRVGERVFNGFPIGEVGTNTFVALFALAHDQAASEEDVKLWAEDRAGNRTEAGFWIRI